jgi:hypothetical protein
MRTHSRVDGNQSVTKHPTHTSACIGLTKGSEVHRAILALSYISLSRITLAR